ncbi:dTDP-4-dehydrorhamnose 3,5-epimerase family protein [Cyanobium sp. HWJ4-Hawea]|uniref:dTDP-4-dehydrorhamnose 3,5-epimerase family protein n=1 Tax=Cyanobium sp. HWJ4-Hawea TaxID=2823713 RepID=UPI0020CD937E|nr:dTDP-4-dehydrorhamnose 3,5-epimerase family protein [Cyanobium sp. HWJ4-Hawea]
MPPLQIELGSSVLLQIRWLGLFNRSGGIGASRHGTGALLIPEGCAHGFQVLEASSELLYLHSGAWVPEAETGLRFDDAQLA